MDYSRQPSTPPRTPQKSNHNTSRNGSAATVTESVSKTRSKGKNRPKTVMTSPAVRNDRSTPPLTGAQTAGMPINGRPTATPSTAAFAGATFHASPAPSALPIPSFYSKSVPDSPALKALPTRKEDSTSNSSDSPTPPAALGLVTQSQREESPLDLFFKADREEKARTRSTSSQQGPNKAFGPFPPPSESPQPEYNTPGSETQNRTQPTHFSGGPTSGMFAMELDGTNSPGKPYGPAFSTPYQERINAARSSSSSQGASPQTSAEPQVDRSEALKAYLFSGPKQTPPNSRPNDSAAKMENRTTITSDSKFRHSSNPVPSPRGAPFKLPTRPHSNSLHFVPDSALYNTSSRAESRSSGLRQEVTPTRTPISTPERAETSSESQFNLPLPSKEISSTVHPNSSGNLTLSQNTAAPSEGRSNDIRSMENNLRRILNLGPTDSANSTAQSIVSFPAAHISVPSYAGGRPASTNDF